MGAPSPEPAPELVCFDWGGVILRICRSWREACDRAGLPFHEHIATPDLTHQRRGLAHRYQIGAIGEAEFFDAVAEATAGAYSAREVEVIHDTWLIEEYPGVSEVIAELARVGRAATGLLSNTNARHWARHLPTPEGSPPDFPTIGVLEHRHASHLLGHAKPDRDIYAAFEARTGFSGGSILFFDDLEENIDAARAHGWRTFRVDHEGDTAAQIRGELERRGLV